MRRSRPGPRAPGRADRAGTFTEPICTTWESTPIPSSARNALQQAPTATRAAVSRALARSRTLRTSSNPYFCTPTRSACPGRGRVRRASGSSAPSTDMRSAYFASNSTFGIVIATGAPEALPVAHARQDLEPVRLEPLPAAASVAVPAPRELPGDLLRDDAHAGREALQDRDQRFPVRFAGREHPQHAAIIGTGLPRLDGAGAAPRRGRPRAGDRSPRGRIAGTGTRLLRRDEAEREGLVAVEERGAVARHVPQLEVASRERRHPRPGCRRCRRPRPWRATRRWS